VLYCQKYAPSGCFFGDFDPWASSFIIYFRTYTRQRSRRRSKYISFKVTIYRCCAGWKKKGKECPTREHNLQFVFFFTLRRESFTKKRG